MKTSPFFLVFLNPPDVVFNHKLPKAEQFDDVEVLGDDRRGFSGITQVHQKSIEIPVILGEDLFLEKYYCNSCHMINGKGGYYGPALDKVGERFKPGFLYARLKNPQAYVLDTREPNLNIPDADARALTAFLTSLTGEAFRRF